jgi:hypothetical protein
MLAEAYPGTVVERVEFKDSIGGTASKVRLSLTYNDVGNASGLPSSAWLKGGFESHGFAHSASYVAEARFFGRWAKEIPINIPRSWWQAEADDGSQGLVLLEDLDDRGARYGRCTLPASLDEARRVLALLARLHGWLWDSAVLGSLRSYTDRFAAADYWLDKFLDPEHFVPLASGPRGTNAPSVLRTPDGMRSAIRAMWSFTTEHARAMCHGDCHIGNTFFEPDGAAGLLDWQAYLRGDPMLDVVYFLGGALDTDVRRQHEKELIRFYLDELAAAGVCNPPGFDQAWLSYRRYAPHGFLWVATPLVMQPEEISRTYALRYGALCADLDTLGALGVD